jgi:hypothetical protein
MEHVASSVFAYLQVKIQVARGWERQDLCRLTSEANLHMLTVVTGTPLQQSKSHMQPIFALFAWLISHQPTVLFSQNKPAISNQPAVLFSENKPALAIRHQLSGIHPGYSCKEGRIVEDELLVEFPCTPTRTRSVYSY